MAAATKSSKFVLTTSHSALRSSLRRPDGQPSHPTPGQLLQINTVDQFSEWSRAAIQEFKGPNAVCGFCTMGNALILNRLLRTVDRSQTLSKAKFEEIVAEMRNEQKALQEMRQAMQFIHGERTKWMAKQDESYWKKYSKTDCLRVWAANHELSDFMIGRAAGDANLGNVNFLRYNQWPERGAGQWEEAERLVEEQPFGGETEGDKATVQLEPGASRFIVERFSPARILQRPGEWLQEEQKRQAGGKSLPPNIFMLDLNGHYAVGVGLLLETEASSVVPTFVIFNTTNGNYLSTGAPTVAFDLAFPPNESAKAIADKK